MLVFNTPSPQANLSLNESNASFIRFLVGEKSNKNRMGNGTNRTIEKNAPLEFHNTASHFLVDYPLSKQDWKIPVLQNWVDGESSQLAMYGC